MGLLSRIAKSVKKRMNRKGTDVNQTQQRSLPQSPDSDGRIAVAFSEQLKMGKGSPFVTVKPMWQCFDWKRAYSPSTMHAHMKMVHWVKGTLMVWWSLVRIMIGVSMFQVDLSVSRQPSCGVL